MAKKGFNFGDTQVAKTAEDIRTENRMPAPETAAAEETATAPTPAPKRQPAPAHTAEMAETADGTKAKKADVGITIQLPKKYHRVLRDIRDETGVPVRDLALRAVMEFVDNYKFEE